MTGRGFGRALFSSPGGRSPPPLSPNDTSVAPFPGQTVPPGPRACPFRLRGADQTPSARPRVPPKLRLRRQRAPLLAPRPAGRSVFPPFPRLRPQAPAAWTFSRLSLPERFLPRQRSRRPQGIPSRKRPIPSSAVPAPRSGSDAVRKAPRVPQNSGSAGSAPVLRRSFRSSFSSIGSAGSAPGSSPLVPQGVPSPPLFSRLLRPCAASSCRKKRRSYGLSAMFPERFPSVRRNAPASFPCGPPTLRAPSMLFTRLWQSPSRDSPGSRTETPSSSFFPPARPPSPKSPRLRPRVPATRRRP